MFSCFSPKTHIENRIIIINIKWNKNLIFFKLRVCVENSYILTMRVCWISNKIENRITKQCGIEKKFIKFKSGIFRLNQKKIELNKMNWIGNLIRNEWMIGIYGKESELGRKQSSNNIKFSFSFFFCKLFFFDR